MVLNKRGCKIYMAEYCIDRSIYDELKEFYSNNNGEIYSYQDLEQSGLNEFNVVLHKAGKLKLYEKNRLAYDFVKILLSVCEGHDTIKDLEEYVTLNPSINYYKSIEKLLKGICEEESKRKYISDLILKIITQSSCPELVKAAIISLTYTDINNKKEILEIYSIHNEYLFYVLNSYEHMGICNEEFFEIAQKSKGYGRVFAVMHLKPVTYEMTDWMIVEGCNNEVASSELTYLTMLSTDLIDYMNKTCFSKDKVEALSKSFSIMLSDYGLNEVKDEVGFCNKLLSEINRYPSGIYSLYITISILYSIEAELIDYYKEKKINIQVSLYNKYKDIMDVCRIICSKEEWKIVVENEMSNLGIESSVLITCAEKIGYKIKKKEFEALFKRDYSNALLYKYAFSVGSKSIKKSIYSMAVKKLNISELTSGPGEFTVDKLKYEDIEHICFFIMTKYMNYEDFEDEYKEFNMKALKSPLIETRIQAVTNLEKFKGHFDEEETAYIKQAISVEMISSIRRGLNSLIIDEEKIHEKIVSVDDLIDIKVHVKDIYMTSANVECKDKYDRSSLLNRMQENDIVYMVREPDNIDDPDTVLVVTDKGVVIGTIPLNIEQIIKNLMDKGKYFYGKVESISDNYEDISISIIMSYKDVLDDIGDTLMLLSNEGNEFIQ